MKTLKIALAFVMALALFLGSPLAPQAAAIGAGIISVSDFGAVGDGVTDDTSALSEAIAVSGQLGAPLYLPPGRYFITQSIVLSDSIEIFGSGHDKSIITANGTPTRAGFIIRESGTIIRDLGFEQMVEPIALDSRAGYVLQGVRIERNRFEAIQVLDRNRGVIGLTTAGSPQRPHPIQDITIRENIFQDINPNAVNIRANIREAKVIGNQFIGLNNPRRDSDPGPRGGYAIRLGDDPDLFPEQGSHRIEGNVIRNMSKLTVDTESDENLVGILVYGNHNLIQGNLIENIDGTAKGQDVNAMDVRGSYNRIIGNVISNIHGDDDDGALCIKGDSNYNIIAYNYFHNIRGMSAAQITGSNLQFHNNVVVDADTRGFYHRLGTNLSLENNIFVGADVQIRTQYGEVYVAQNEFLDATLSLSQLSNRPAQRDAVYIHDNLFQHSGSKAMIRLTNSAVDPYVSIKDNRIHSKAQTTVRVPLVDLSTGGTVNETDIIGNHVVLKGAYATVFRMGSAAGSGRFAENLIVLDELRGPLLESGFTVIEGNTVRIASQVAAPITLPTLFAMRGYAPDATMLFRNNRILIEDEKVHLREVTQWQGQFNQGGQVVFSGNWLEGSFTDLGRFGYNNGQAVTTFGNVLPVDVEPSFAGL